MPLVGDQVAAVQGCSSGFADGLAEHPQGRKKLIVVCRWSETRWRFKGVAAGLRMD